MTVTLWLIAALICLLGSAFFSGAEMGLYSLNRLRLRVQVGKNDPPQARMLLRLHDNRQETVLAILLGNNLANYLLTTTASLVLIGLAGLNPNRAEFYTAALVSPIIFVFGDVVPKNWFQFDTERLMNRSARLLRVTVEVFRWTGVLWLLRQMTRVGARLAGHDANDDWREPRGEIVGLLREVAAHGALSEEQADIFQRVMELPNVRIGAIMVPRGRVVAVTAGADRETLERLVRVHDYSRMPVLSKDGRAVLGVVNVFDVLADESPGTVEKWMCPALTVRASDSAALALVRLQRNKSTMAVVTDPRRGFVGLITLKDVVEEILGPLPAW